MSTNHRLARAAAWMACAILAMPLLAQEPPPAPDTAAAPAEEAPPADASVTDAPSGTLLSEPVDGATETPPEPGEPPADTRALDETVQGLKKDVVDLNRELFMLDLWDNTSRRVKVAPLAGRKGQCPCCAKKQFDWLEGEQGTQTTTLCGRNAVQVTPRAGTKLDFGQVTANLKGSGTVTANKFLLKAALSDAGEGREQDDRQGGLHARSLSTEAAQLAAAAAAGLRRRKSISRKPPSLPVAQEDWVTLRGR